MATFSRTLEATLRRALALANEHRHEYVTLEHLLLSLIDDDDAAHEGNDRERRHACAAHRRDDGALDDDEAGERRQCEPRRQQQSGRVAARQAGLEAAEVTRIATSAV